MTDTTEFPAPSGAIYQVRPVSVIDACYDGLLTDPLTATVEEAILDRNARLSGNLTTAERERINVDIDAAQLRQREILIYFVPGLARDFNHVRELRRQGYKNAKLVTDLPVHDFWALWYAAMGDAAAVQRVFQEYERITPVLGVAQSSGKLRDDARRPVEHSTTSAMGESDGNSGHSSGGNMGQCEAARTDGQGQAEMDDQRDIEPAGSVAVPA